MDRSDACGVMIWLATNDEVSYHQGSNEAVVSHVHDTVLIHIDAYQAGRRLKDDLWQYQPDEIGSIYR